MVKASFCTSAVSQSYLPYVASLYTDFAQQFSRWLHERASLQLALPPILLNHRFNLIKNFRPSAGTS